ncbi:hypothetical protein AMECASPLE_026223 [Ameca splendens]|uniref:Uncharacterized protein n=1 Tax=Ameca splendens TaxID=208324 RepID=A0ABV0XTS1_9TELE
MWEEVPSENPHARGEHANSMQKDPSRELNQDLLAVMQHCYQLRHRAAQKTFKYFYLVFISTKFNYHLNWQITTFTHAEVCTATVGWKIENLDDPEEDENIIWI